MGSLGVNVPILEAKGIKRWFGGLAALADVEFEVEQGQILGVIGPNGAGKTTLFNVICGFYPPSEGQIRFDGAVISGMRPHVISRRGIARTFQVPRYFHGMTVVENVMVGALFGHTSNYSLKKAREEAAKLLEGMGFAGRVDMPVSALNAIDARRLELVRAVVSNPKIILLDEVMAGLNSTEVCEAMALIASLKDELGVTVILVEHIMQAVMGISDKIVVLANGRVIAQGTPKEISRDPAVLEAYLGGCDIPSV